MNLERKRGKQSVDGKRNYTGPEQPNLMAQSQILEQPCLYSHPTGEISTELGHWVPSVRR